MVREGLSIAFVGILREVLPAGRSTLWRYRSDVFDEHRELLSIDNPPQETEPARANCVAAMPHADALLTARGGGSVGRSDALIVC